MNVYKSPVGQPELNFEEGPFEIRLDPKNRWVRLAKLIPWEELERSIDYRKHFGTTGAPALPFRVAFGALVIQTKLRTTDEETVQQIRENPYLQYFLGYGGYRGEAPFTSSLMVLFRKRLDRKTLDAINLQIFRKEQGLREEAERKERERTEPGSGGDACGSADAPSGSGGRAEETGTGSDTAPKGTLLLDATCTPADITYPTDLKVLITAREELETLIDVLYERSGRQGEKPRTYRKQAKAHAVIAGKQRRLAGKKLRRALRKQLSYVGRDLRIIETILATFPNGKGLLTERERAEHATVIEIHKQQKAMLDTQTHHADKRIVSRTQPHVRPIVRGKAGCAVEFGAKIAIAVDNGYSIVVRLDWENFNEGQTLQEACEAYRERRGYWPEVVCADMIYRTRSNRAWCEERRIRLSGPPLGRPVKDGEKRSEQKRLEREDSAKRNGVEGKFGEGKRAYGLDRIRGKLKATSESIIVLQFITMNLWRMLRFLLFFFSEVCKGVKKSLYEVCFIHNLCTRTLLRQPFFITATW